MELKNKFFLIILLFLFLVLLCTNSFASFDFTYGGVSYSYPDIPTDNSHSNYIITNPDNLEFDCLFLFPSDLSNLSGNDHVTTSGNIDNFTVSFYLNNAGGLKVYYYYPDTSSWVYHHTLNAASAIYSTDNILYSSFDLITEDGVTVFQGAPVTVEPMEMKQVEEILPEIWKIATMILPGCLLIFGMLLVVYLIKSKNLLQL